MLDYLPKLETKTILNYPIEVSPSVDETDHYDFPFKLDKLPRLLAHSRQTTDRKVSNLASKTITENRAFSYPPVVFMNHDTKIIYYDLLEKGVGTEIRPYVELRKTNYFLDWATEVYPYIPAEIDTKDGKIIVRFSPDQIETLTSYLGVHDYDSGLIDKHTSAYLESRGLRTRAMLAAWKLPPNTPMATPEGIITTSEFQRKTDIEPGIELWAMRCKYRVMDILRYIYEQENENNLHEFIPLAGVSNSMWSEDQPNHLYDPTRFDKKTQKRMVDTFLELANSILVRTKTDSHPLFKELYQKFRLPLSTKNLSVFYAKYLLNFSSVLGEQFALMRREKVILGMFSVQNVGLLAEVVDNDTTIVDGKVMNKEGIFVKPSEEELKMYKKYEKATPEEYFEQLEIGHDGIRSMLRDLSRAGILKISEIEMRDITRNFISTYIANTGRLSADIIKLAKERYQGEYQQMVTKGKPPDYFGRDELLCFVEDILEISQTKLI